MWRNWNFHTLLLTKWYNHFGKQISSLLKHLIYNPAILLLVFTPKKKNYKSVQRLEKKFIATLFVIAKNWKRKVSIDYQKINCGNSIEPEHGKENREAIGKKDQKIKTKEHGLTGGNSFVKIQEHMKSKVSSWSKKFSQAGPLTSMVHNV